MLGSCTKPFIIKARVIRFWPFRRPPIGSESPDQRHCTDALETGLKQRAALTHTNEVLSAMGKTAAGAAEAARRARLGLRIVQLAAGLGGVIRGVFGEAAARNLARR